VLDLLLAGVGRVLQQRRGGHDHPRGAEAALQAVAVDEGLLDRVALGPLRQAFDAGDPPTLGLQRQHGAALHRLAVEQHRAGAALAGVAADMRAGQAQLLAQYFDQQALRLDLQLHGPAVDFEVQVAHGCGVLSSAKGDRSAPPRRVQG
jgi:hypothetical protein